MSNNIIDPAQNGIYCNSPGKSPLILDNTIIKENQQYDYQVIWIENNTAAYIAHNDISGFYWGIYCGGGVNSYFGDYEFHDSTPITASEIIYLVLPMGGEATYMPGKE